MVVVTYHASHRGSIAPRLANDVIASGYVSDLSDVIEQSKPDL